MKFVRKGAYVIMQTSRSAYQGCITYQEFFSAKHGRSRSSRRYKFDQTYDPIVAGTKDGSGNFINDRAIIRAFQANFRPPALQSNPKKTVFVGRLQLTVTEDQIQQLFSKCGTIRHIRLVHNLITGASRGYAFVTFKHSSGVRAAMEMHGTIVDGRSILVELEVGRTLPGWKPRRLGGGFGGRKESGQMRFGGRACPHQAARVTASVGERVRLDSLGRTTHDRPYSAAKRRRRNDRSQSRSQKRSAHSPLQKKHFSSGSVTYHVEDRSPSSGPRNSSSKKK
ncbi:U11/U12 small nuclear ribonucleoprotein 35 kDa protein-like isoform X2 [Varroa jacobsoni]|uniref:U11/U12 small nuclear ribonucleoprotein 35 kDa protein-like isoform X2 n=1 Tax=Varroa jacobsoni TaxID=62625 RepID=UPI000BF2929A|nr:U11/U12 small nuclear ribonucleoprotein 35 kDa protein-like isoform X2 [Varroa jacobsoni]